MPPLLHCSAEFFHGGYKKLWNVLVGKSLGQYFVAFLLHPTYFKFIAQSMMQKRVVLYFRPLLVDAAQTNSSIKPT